jgi:hypothetical protein
MDVFCGIDWAEDHHDIALADRDGKLLARRRISDDAAGLASLLALLAEHGDTAGDPVPVAIETPRGLLVACLRATSRKVYPVNPMAVARYRDRHSIAGRKSDHGDAFVLANVLRTDMHAHRPLPADSELAQAIAVLARAQQDAVWDRTTAHNRLRSHLREYFPGFLAAFAGARDGIMRPEARTILAAAPAPAGAAALTLAQLRALLKKAGRSRGIDAEAARLREAFRKEQMRQLPLVEQAMGQQALALLRQLDAACTSAEDLEQAAIESFNQHPDAGIITSFPGLGQRHTRSDRARRTSQVRPGVRRSECDPGPARPRRPLGRAGRPQRHRLSQPRPGHCLVGRSARRRCTSGCHGGDRRRRDPSGRAGSHRQAGRCGGRWSGRALAGPDCAGRPDRRHPWL